MQFRKQYIVGASFSHSKKNESMPLITAWFNNFPYHSPAVSLGLVLNTIYREQLKCKECYITFSNYPLPYKYFTQMEQIHGQTLGYKVAFYLGISMAFVSSFYVLFVVKEIASKSKHLQFISGVKVYIFWLTSFICDLSLYIITVLVFLITLYSLQYDGFSSGADIGK